MKMYPQLLRGLLSHL